MKNRIKIKNVKLAVLNLTARLTCQTRFKFGSLFDENTHG